LLSTLYENCLLEGYSATYSNRKIEKQVLVTTTNSPIPQLLTPGFLGLLIEYAKRHEKN
jgi:hypothetical protein